MCGAGKHESRPTAEEGASASERIAIVTGIPTSPCTNPYGDYMLSLSIQNKQVRGAAADKHSTAHELPRMKQCTHSTEMLYFSCFLHQEVDSTKQG